MNEELSQADRSRLSKVMESEYSKHTAIYSWMVKDLGLRGSELIAYALIYGINQHCGVYYGGAEYLASTWLGTSTSQGYRVLNSLVGKGLLEKNKENGNTFYCALTPDGDNIFAKMRKTFANTRKNFAKTRIDNIYNNIDNNIDINNNISTIDNTNKDSKDKITKKDINISLFDNKSEDVIEESVRGEREGENGGSKMELANQRHTIENLCLFIDSKFAKFENFAAEFKSAEYEQIDIYYYYHAVMDWSNSSGGKKRDWIATARNFMRKDKDANKLHLKKKTGVALSPEAIHYLEMCGGLFDE